MYVIKTCHNFFGQLYLSSTQPIFMIFFKNKNSLNKIESFKKKSSNS